MTLLESLENQGYLYIREVAGGTLIGLRGMLATTGLFVGLDKHGYHGRYCYATHEDALEAIKTWDGAGRPPGPWIKWKGPDGDVNGPGSQGANHE